VAETCEVSLVKMGCSCAECYIMPSIRRRAADNEFILAATAQNLRKMAKLIPMPAP
jgi:hypothetical protein